MASRKSGQRRARREEQRARERAAAEAERRRRLLVNVASVALAAAVVVPFAIIVLGPRLSSGGGEKAGSGDFPVGSVPAPGQLASDLRGAAEGAACRLRDPPDEGREHTTDTVRYRSNPPASGAHPPTPADDGAYVDAPSVGNLVHALEHGRIVIWFRPSAPRSLRGDLKALFDEDDHHLLLTPNETGMPYQVAASAWGHVLGCPRANARVFDAIRAFRDEYRDEGPETVP